MPVPAEELERHRRARDESGLRADEPWVAWVAEHGRDGGMTLNIPLTDDELAELEARSERGVAASGAWQAARLPGAAGFWIEQRAGGLLHFVLAHPDADDLATAHRLAAEYGGTVDLVEHSTRELDRVRTLIDEESARHPDLAEAVMGHSTDVWTNAVHLTLRGDVDPAIPESLRTAVDAGTLVVEHPQEPFGWEPHEAPARRDALPDAPLPRWPRSDGEFDHAHWLACVQVVADRATDRPLDEAVRLAEDIGLHVRVVRPGEAVLQNLVIGRITVYVNAQLLVRQVSAE